MCMFSMLVMMWVVLCCARLSLVLGSILIFNWRIRSSFPCYGVWGGVGNMSASKQWTPSSSVALQPHGIAVALVQFAIC